MEFLDEIKYLDKLIEEVSVSDLYAVSSKLLSERKSIIIILIRLEKLKRIKIENDGIKIIDKNYNGLFPAERFVLDRIRDGRVYIEANESSVKIVCKQAINNKLKKKAIIDLECIYVVLIYLIAMMVGISDLAENMKLLVGWATILLFTCGCVALNIFLDENVAKYKILANTKKGNAVQDRLNEFKSYFLNNENDLVMWENYNVFKEIYSINITEYGDKYNNFIILKNKTLGE